MKIKQLMMASGIVFVSTLMSSCEKIFDDVQDCGLYLNFKYDYNMLYADAFHSQVNNMQVYVFDRDSNFLFKQTEEGERLSQKGYRMKLDIPISEHETYLVMAWAGNIEKFALEPLGEDPVTISDLKLKLNQEIVGYSNNDIGNLWYGEIKEIVYEPGTEQTEVVNLIKDTNRFRIVLQKVGEGDPISVNDLSFELLVDNSYYNYKNEIIPTDIISYQPYFTDDIETIGAVAELNTMRITDGNDIKLKIHDTKNNRELLNIDLLKYLLAIQMEGYKMTTQEYLDRQSEFTIILFYNVVDSTPYLSAKIIVNNWTVWMQDAEL